ncbi:MAG TPA: hypothetical protein VMD77_16165 [Candidatus Baltobacteraceae bacterium]|nr:hypothetical protein [Candidatus Baltobacteraceae bacterium]
MAFFLTLLASAAARADVGVILNDSLDTSVARITGSGHSAIYFSRICPASPVKLRLCGPGEHGSVMSNYTTLGEDTPFEWNVVPFDVYVYGVENPVDRPLFASPKIKGALEDAYREKVLADYCESRNCETSGKAEWREMVSAESERTFYILIASTTVAQDRELIDEFNSLPNVNHFNGVTRNCADFTKHVIDTYFPHAAHRDFINDFGMTSPKAVARSFAHWAHRHPQTQYRVVHFAQLPGTIKRSSECRSGTEQLYHSKKLLLPMAFFLPHELAIVTGSYVLTGRFNVQKEYEEHATIRETALGDQLKVAKSDDETETADTLAAEEAKERADAVGTAEEWKAYREKFDSIVDDAVQDGTLASKDALGHVFERINSEGEPFLDDSGALWMSVRQDDGSVARVGLTPSNVLAEGSDRKLATQVILANINEVLKSPARRRETLAEFEDTWHLLEEAGTPTQVEMAAERAPSSSPRMTLTRRFRSLVP